MILDYSLVPQETYKMSVAYKKHIDYSSKLDNFQGVQSV